MSAAAGGPAGERLRQLNVRVPAELHARLRDVAGREDRTVQVVVRRIVEAYVEDPDAPGRVQAALDRAEAARGDA